MAEEKLVYQNADGIRRTAIFDRDTPDVFHVKTEVDMESVVDTNRELQDLHPRRSTNKLVARVPMTVYEQSIHEGWDEDDWKRWLNDPENKHFRVWPGRV